MLFYIKYGCDCCTEELIIRTDTMRAAEEYAYMQAQDVYYSFSQNDIDRYEYDDLTDEEFNDMEYQMMTEGIYYFVELYDPNNEEHKDLLNEQDGIPFEV